MSLRHPKKGVPRKQYRYSYRVKHPVCFKADGKGNRILIPITSSSKEKGHKHILLPSKVRLFSKKDPRSKDVGKSYAVDRVIVEKDSRNGISKPSIGRMTKANRKVFQKIYRKRKKKD